MGTNGKHPLSIASDTPAGTSARTVIIGDIHGCGEELLDLVEKINLQPGDHLVTIGDLVVKGPRPREVIDFVLDRPNTTNLLGNMEWRLMEEGQGRKQRRGLPQPYIETIEALGNKRWKRLLEAMSTWPLLVNLGSVTCVHAGVRPDIAFGDQRPHDLMHIRTIEVSKKNGKARVMRPWWKLYEGPETIVFGHTVFSEPLVTEHAIGIDTGCVYGGHLTALILPSREIVQVPSRRVHWEKGSKAHVIQANPLLSDS